MRMRVAIDVYLHADGKTQIERLGNVLGIDSDMGELTSIRAVPTALQPECMRLR